MSDAVKTRRAYNSAARQDQARRTRWAIVQSARHEFLERGFSATTMPAIATRAGVSVQTVYKAFGNKARLVKAVFDTAIAGDDEPTPMLERTQLMRAHAEPDPRRKLLLYGRFLTTVAPRHVPIQLLIRDAAATDQEAAVAWEDLQQERLQGMAQFAKSLHDAGHLRDGVSAREARDVLWTYNSAELFQLLVLHRGWTPRRYGTWIAHQLIAALLVPLDDVTAR